MHLQEAQTLMPGCCQVTPLPFLLCDITVLLRRVLSQTDTSSCSRYSHGYDEYSQTLMPSCHTFSVMPATPDAVAGFGYPRSTISASVTNTSYLYCTFVFS